MSLLLVVEEFVTVERKLSSSKLLRSVVFVITSLAKANSQAKSRFSRVKNRYLLMGTVLESHCKHVYM